MVMAKKIVFEIIADSDCTTPVSYTHLDVYKRQDYNRVIDLFVEYNFIL